MHVQGRFGGARLWLEVVQAFTLVHLDASLSAAAVFLFSSPPFSRNFSQLAPDAAVISAANNHSSIPSRPSVCCLCEAKSLLPQEVVRMLWTIFVILLVLWLVGLVSSYTLGGFIHLLLVAAVVVLILQLISGRRPVV